MLRTSGKYLSGEHKKSSPDKSDELYNEFMGKLIHSFDLTYLSQSLELELAPYIVYRLLRFRRAISLHLSG